MLKWCYCCKTHKPLDEFGKNARNKDGKTDECRVCKRQKDREYASRNREKAKEKSLAWYAENKDNPEYKQKAKLRQKLWRSANLDKHANKEAKRRTQKLKAFPKWLSEEQLQQIQTEYALCKWCTEVMNTSYHVDHIVPLQGKNVCGLHVPWNLRVIPANENMRKGNKHVV
jgi:hypothetical protein